MPIPQLVIIVVIALIAGGLAIAILGMRRGVGGLDFLVAVIGSFLFDWISHAMAFPVIVPITYHKVEYEFIWSLLGAFLFIFLLRFASDSTA